MTTFHPATAVGARAARAPNESGPSGGRLPGELSSFVGRGRELDEVLAAFEEGARLVTIVGPGGAGKTRLAVRAARRMDGARWFCPLSTARDGGELVSAVATSLGLWIDRAGARDSMQAQLGRALADGGTLLLVLDNVEQIVEPAAAAIRGWLESAPQARLLVTSREPLLVEGERVVDLRSLEPSDAVALFEERARATGASVEAAERAIVEAIVRELDGLPLAIELAAAKADVLSLEQIRRGLSARFELLRSSRRDVDPRHASLASVIGWSWARLDEAERRALARWSVFRGGFELEAAAALTDEQDGERASSLVELLCRRSLLRSEPVDGWPRRRFQLYESVREWAARELERDPEAQRDAERRHARHFVARAERWAADSRGARAPVALRSLSLERDNLVAIVDRFEHSGPELAARAAFALEPLLSLRGPFDAHMALAKRALEAAERTGDGVLVGRALVHRGAAHKSSGQLTEARSDAARALERLTDPVGRAAALHLRGRTEHIAGRSDEAASFLGRAVRAARRAGDDRLLALALGDRGDLRRDARALREALAIAERAGDRSTEVHVLWALGRLERDRGHAVEAVAHLERALALNHEIGSRRHEGLIVGSLASALHFAGRTEEARKSYRQSAALHARMGNTMMHGWMLCQLAALEHETGRLGDAHALLSEARRLAQACGSARTEVVALAHLSALAVAWKRLEEARASLDAARRIVDRRDRHARAVVDRIGRLLRPARRRPRKPHKEEPELIVLHAERVAAAVRARASEPPARSEPPPAPEGALVVAADAAWFRPPGGGLVSLDRRLPLRRLLAALVEARRERPGRALSIEELVAAGWPAEKLTPSSASNRLRNAVSTLRKIGLREVLMTRNDGYLLDPERWIARGD